MSRPSKPISPDTLGGRLRATREKFHWSLQEVADDKCSTSLISQIERNRIDPSANILEYLADKLQLPLAELQALAQKQHESESEAQRHKFYEEQLTHANRALMNNNVPTALEHLQPILITQAPSSLRWRIAALRGHCYFKQRHFLKALRDFLYAVTELPTLLPTDPEQQLEAMTLHLHLAATYRELEQLEEAFQHYHKALSLVNTQTPFGYLAETHWGLSLVAYNRATKTNTSLSTPEQYIQEALQHAEHARSLYRSTDEGQLQVALLTCQMALIELVQGHRNEARTLLREVLDTWKPVLAQKVGYASTQRREEQEYANVVSAAACYLAEVEFQDSHYDAARRYVDLALAAGKQSYILRQAEAQMMLGRILEVDDLHGEATTQAFKEAVAVLAPTDRVSAQIRAHDFLGRHLLKKGDIAGGDAELDRARKLSSASATFSSATTSAEDVTEQR